MFHLQHLKHIFPKMAQDGSMEKLRFQACHNYLSSAAAYKQHVRWWVTCVASVSLTFPPIRGIFRFRPWAGKLGQEQNLRKSLPKPLLRRLGAGWVVSGMGECRPFLII